MRPILPSVSVPSLVMAPPGSSLSRYLADHLPNSEYVEFDDPDFYACFAGDSFDMLMERTEQFITGRPRVARSTRVLATVLFSDIVRSTETLARRGDSSWRRVLDEHDAITDREVRRYNGNVVKTTGDGFVATFATPGDALDAAMSMTRSLADLRLPIRAGLHTGEIEIREGDIAGIAVHITARVASLASSEGEILVTRTVRDLVAGSRTMFTSVGSHALKGVPDEWELFTINRE